MPRARSSAPAPDLRLAREALGEEARRAILASAATILSDEGPSALTVRRVAQAVNASTKMIYTHFGNKDGLLDALYLHSFEGLAEALRSCGGIADPLARLRAAATAYHDYARAEPAFYNIMFGDLGRAYEAPPESRRTAWRTFETLRAWVADCLPPQRQEEADDSTRLLWVAMHGATSLELRGLLGRPADSARLLDDAVEAVIRIRLKAGTNES